MDAWGGFALAAFASALLLGAGLAHIHRRKTMRSFAMRMGFTFIGDTLPPSFIPSGYPLEGITAVWNAMDGEVKGLGVLVFDCRIGKGKGSWQRTIVAAKSQHAVFNSIDGNYGLELGRVGDWTILYRPKELTFFSGGLMPIPELKARISSIST